MSAKTSTSQPLGIVAAVLAWLIPGAGHIYVGRVRRGIIICVTVAATFWAGMAMGGSTTVDSRHERWWFIGQMLSGVHGLVGWQIEKNVYSRLEDQAQAAYGNSEPLTMERQAAREGVALVAPGDVVARAYSGVAGLLNLMCIFDVVMLTLMGQAAEPKIEPETDTQQKV